MSLFDGIKNWLNGRSITDILQENNLEINYEDEHSSLSAKIDNAQIYISIHCGSIEESEQTYSNISLLNEWISESGLLLTILESSINDTPSSSEAGSILGMLNKINQKYHQLNMSLKIDNNVRLKQALDRESQSRQ